MGRSSLSILIPNKQDQTLTIADTGIRMTNVDLIRYFGKVAKNTFVKAFMGALQAGASLVLFFTVCFIAQKVTVVTKPVMVSSMPGNL